MDHNPSILPTYRGWRDHAEHLHILDSIVILEQLPADAHVAATFERVNGITRNA